MCQLWADDITALSLYRDCDHKCVFITLISAHMCSCRTASSFDFSWRLKQSWELIKISKQNSKSFEELRNSTKLQSFHQSVLSLFILTVRGMERTAGGAAVQERSPAEEPASPIMFESSVCFIG